ncbi:membrane protein insertase YidC [Hyphococcus luteus]|uniref:Membrane protein insertase YidC n=1 Tax=Hyphococcus luteus TaxID=2058213 RepID=A0A2S7K9N0_9PROT|nr:membrane protein insertase YidC [Marinicaulis flavus]PQA89193.1 membrane protein insertase YidC [Marinicaulis flavus]
MDRNVILAIVLSMGVFLAWDFFVLSPQRDAQRAAQAEQATQEAEAEAQSMDPNISGLTDEKAALTVEEAIANSTARVPIKTPTLEGSINLKGGRLDDLKLMQYHQTVDDKSPPIRLLSPADTEHGHYMQQGWAVGRDTAAHAQWTVAEGDVLTPQTPVTLKRESGGVAYEKTISVDDKYMFTVTQTVTNTSGDSKTLLPYAAVVQRNMPLDYIHRMILQEGPLGVIGTKLYERKYNKLKKNKDAKIEESGVGGWVGITNKFWLAASIPPADAEIKATLANTSKTDEPVFQSYYEMKPVTLEPGETQTMQSYMFGGPKDVDLLQSYEHKPENGGLGIYDFDKAVDWGHLFFLTRPIFYTLNFFGDTIGNFGVAILLLVLIIKLILFPLANKGYESMSKMKKLQPEIKKLQERYEDDKMKLQQEMMALYKKEQLNPLAGCLPILLQMPIFFALYKTLFVTIELRHQPFLYISDLSAPDPTTIFNLFGLLPFDPTVLPIIGGLLGIGFLPLLMGVAMWFQTKLNPPPADPVQAQIFGLMPFVFVFIFASFAAGLVLYWFWNTTLGIFQQWYIMKKNGVKVELGQRLNLPWAKKDAAAGDAKAK